MDNGQWLSLAVVPVASAAVLLWREWTMDNGLPLAVVPVASAAVRFKKCATVPVASAAGLSPFCPKNGNGGPCPPLEPPCGSPVCPKVPVSSISPPDFSLPKTIPDK